MSTSLSGLDLVFPTRPSVGDTTTGSTGVSWIWDGVKWIARGREPGRPPGAFISDIPPDDPRDGDLWWNTGDNTMHIWLGDEWGDVTLSLMQLGGVEEAPMDGNKYIRIMGEWMLMNVDGGYY